MAPINPFSPFENALGTAIVELIKWTLQDRRDFEQVFVATLKKMFKKYDIKNISILNRALDTLASDPDVQQWIQKGQLSDDLPLLQKLGEILNLPAHSAVMFLQDFFLEYEKAIAKNDTCYRILQSRRQASQTQS